MHFNRCCLLDLQRIVGSAAEAVTEKRKNLFTVIRKPLECDNRRSVTRIFNLLIFLGKMKIQSVGDHDAKGCPLSRSELP